MIKNRTRWIFVLNILALFVLISTSAFTADRDGKKSLASHQNPDAHDCSLHHADRAPQKAFTATETVVGYLDPGTTTISDGIARIRNQVILVYYNTSDSRITGYYRGVVNYNMDSELSGPMWGAIQSADENGNPIADGWVGTFDGQLYSVYPSYNTLLKLTAHGKGANKGLRLEATDAWDSYDNLTPGVMVGLIKGAAEE
jgi:hypothetical protein